MSGRDDDFLRLPKASRSPSKVAPAAGVEPGAAPDPARGPAAAPVAAPLPARTAGEPASGTRLEPSPSAPKAPPAGGRTPASPPPPPPAPPSASPPARRRRRWLWPLLGATTLVVILVGGFIGYWVFMNVAARMLLTDQALRIRLPEQTNTVLTATNTIDVLMKGVITAQVPLRQTLDLPVRGTYDTLIDLDTMVPLETTIVYEGIIPIDTMADIEARAPVNFQNVKKYKNLHFKAKLPMKLNLPVRLVVPVKQQIPFKYQGPLRVTIDHVIRSPVGTTLHTALNVDQAFTIPITTSLPLQMDLPQHPVAATIVESLLYLNLQSLRFERKPDTADDATRPPLAPET